MAEVQFDTINGINGRSIVQRHFVDEIMALITMASSNLAPGLALNQRDLLDSLLTFIFFSLPSRRFFHSFISSFDIIICFVPFDAVCVCVLACSEHINDSCPICETVIFAFILDIALLFIYNHV